MAEEKTFDAGNEEHVEQALRNERQRNRYDNEAWNKVLGTVEGRYIVNAIIEMAHSFEISFNADNPRLTDFREGERNIGNKLIAHAFQGRQHLFSKMRAEHAQRNGEN